MTPANDSRPTVRSMVSPRPHHHREDEFVVELHRTFLKVRPKRSRRGGSAEVIVPVGLLYQQALTARVEAARRDRQRQRREAARLRAASKPRRRR